MKKIALACFLGIGTIATAPGQAPNPTSQPTPPPPNSQPVPVFRTEVVARTIPAVNYRVRSGETKVDFQGTALMPQAKGTAEIGTKRAYTEIDVTFREVGSPAQYGPEFLTFVLWAITPEGRATNLGEVIPKDGRARLEVTTELASFGMIVTAEPYWAVTQPSDVVVMQNIARVSTTGQKDVIEARYELLPRGIYRYDRSQAIQGEALAIDKRNPLDLYEARHAIEIARAAGADELAPDVFAKAVDQLKRAEDYSARKQPTTAIQTVARNAVQIAEDARAITMKRIAELKLAKERADAAERQRQAEDATRREAEERARAEQARIAETARRQEAEQARLAESARRQEAEQGRLAEEQRRIDAEQRAAREAAERARSDQERQAAERARAEAEQAAKELTRLKLEAEAAQRSLAEQQALAKAEADRARAAAEEADRLRQESDRLRQQAEQDRQRVLKEQEQLRQQLKEQFSAILETRDTARGLIVNISDVLFDFGKYTLRPAAREKLARLSGIVLAHPGLILEAEGHTDSVGSDSFNQRLSEQRAQAVMQFLTSQGIKQDNITAKGLGESQPVASNDSNAGRQQNRRVELVVSGEVIGTKLESRQVAPPSAPRN